MRAVAQLEQQRLHAMGGGELARLVGARRDLGDQTESGERLEDRGGATDARVAGGVGDCAPRPADVLGRGEAPVRQQPDGEVILVGKLGVSQPTRTM